MAVRLTEGAVLEMNADGADPNFKPVLQVTDLRKINTQHGGGGGGAERYRLALSDGSHVEQGMLASQHNSLVHQGVLQKGSIVRLTEFTCTVVQNRRIIIIVSLEVLVSECDIIGQPVKLTNAQSPAAIPGNAQSLNSSARGAGHETVTEPTLERPRYAGSTIPGNAQSLNISARGAGHETVTEPTLEQPRYAGSTMLGNAQSLNTSARGAGHETVPEPTPKQPRYGGSYSGSAEPGRYAAVSSVSNHPRPESGSGFAGSAPVSGPYAGQNTGLRSPIPQVSPPLQNSYPPQSTYQQLRPNSYAQPPQSTYQQGPVSPYARPPQRTYQQPPPLYGNRGPVAKNEAPGRIVQICALNQYQGKWTIKARVTAKSELRTYTNARGEGKVFNFDLIDSSGEIRVTCFNNVAEEFYSLIEVGKVYLIWKGVIKTAQRKFNHLDNEYEIQLDATSRVQQCFEDDGSIPQHRFNFRPISDVEGLESNTIVDIIGVVSFISPAASIRTKNGETQKRTLQLKDMSCRSVEVTLWGNLCNVEGQKLQSMCDSGLFPVLAVKAGRVSEFNGKVVGTTAASQLFIEPDDPQADEVRLWFQREGMNSPCVAISRDTNDIWKTLSQIKDEKLGTFEKPDWITVSATVIFIKSDNCFYAACPLKREDRQCNKKVINDGDGSWRCERCEQSVQQCDYRYILNFQIEDHTGTAWVTAFEETGQEIMGITAKDFQYLKHEEQDEDKVAEIIRKVLFTEFVFKLKIKEETFSDEQRVKSTVVKVDKVNFTSKARRQLDLMEKLKKGETAIHCAGMNNTGVGSSAIGQHTPAVNVSYSTNAADASRVFGAPANQGGYVGSQYINPRVPPTGSAGSYPCCNICGGTSHNTLNCPNVMKQSPGGSYSNSRPVASNSGECYKCQQPGHWAKDCPVSNQIPAYGNSGIQPGRYGVSNQRVSY